MVIYAIMSTVRRLKRNWTQIVIRQLFTIYVNSAFSTRDIAQYRRRAYEKQLFDD